MEEMIFAQGSVPVAVVARVYGKDDPASPLFLQPEADSHA